MRKTPVNRNPVAWLAAGVILLVSGRPVTASAASDSDQWEYVAMFYISLLS